ncbi:glycosyltransferase [Anianabacter salinae]|uniref:glycosyltransferase n=1 Tax=Anianabacter salinae TaxID=2851023 RepID=UPI00225E4A7E|nr:glycosyltransferase [Anianabacter salinae]MBV0913474.1 glycosyltransferase [Anianabacter salinae]
MTRALYITYDGVLEPLGQSQVLGYLERLSRDHDLWLVSFEKPADLQDGARRAALAARLDGLGIRWTALRYHKRPSAIATAWDILAGFAVGLWLVLRHRIGVLHARSYVPAAMALPIKRITGARFLFDMRGFWADERTDGGLWPVGGRLYRVTKWLETRFLRGADHLVTLTHASARELASFPAFAGRPMPPVSIIPTCADLDRFALSPPPPATPFVFGYVGSFGTWYMLDETMLAFRAVLARRPEALFLIVNRNEHDMIRAAYARAGLPQDRLDLVSAAHGEVPAQIARMHVAAALIRPCFSKIASAPTKLAEYLGCGVPCLGNVGVGDMEEILEGRGVGVAVTKTDEAAIDEAVGRLLALAGQPDTRQRCRDVAVDLFSLADGVVEFDAIYRALSGPRPGEVAA